MRRCVPAPPGPHAKPGGSRSSGPSRAPGLVFVFPDPAEVHGESPVGCGIRSRKRLGRGLRAVDLARGVDRLGVVVAAVAAGAAHRGGGRPPGWCSRGRPGQEGRGRRAGGSTTCGSSSVSPRQGQEGRGHSDHRGAECETAQEDEGRGHVRGPRAGPALHQRGEGPVRRGRRTRGSGSPARRPSRSSGQPAQRRRP